MKYRKKPVIIEAIQWKGDRAAVEMFFNDLIEPTCMSPITFGSREVYITTLEGTMTASLNDWIIRGVKNELYPCKPDIFKELYDVVEE